MVVKTMDDKTGFYGEFVFIIMGDDIETVTGDMAEVMGDIVVVLFEVDAVEMKVISLGVTCGRRPCEVEGFYICG